MQSAPGDLPYGWQAAFDSRYQRYYYMHPASGVSQWEHPTQKQPQQADAASHSVGEPAVTSADAGHKARAAADTAAPSTQQQQQQRVAVQRMYHYYDPWGRLMGPFTISQLTAWRPFLPMDLQLIPSQQAAADDASGAQAETSAPDPGSTAALPLALADESGCCKETDAAAGAPAAGAEVQPSRQDAVGQTVQQPPTDPAAAQDSHKAGASPCEALAATADSRAPEAAATAAAAAAAEAAGAACSQSEPADQAAADAGAATAAAGSVVAGAAASPDTAAAAAGDGSLADLQEQNNSADTRRPKAAAVYLADLLGDSDLLKHFQQSQKQQQQQQQPDVQGPPRAAAPPAPVWQAWVAQHSSTAAAAAAAAPTAPASWQQQQRQQDLPSSMLTIAAANFSSSSSKDQNRSSFDKYAAAVLQGLPPEDEAVQLARVAAVHGYSLSQVLQPQQMSGVASGAHQGDGLPGGLTITAQGVTAMMVKDPRSGRLSVAAGGSSGGSSAAELYGDLARWCDPASLERTLHKKRQQEQLQPGKAVVVSPAGGSGAAKRTRLITG